MEQTSDVSLPEQSTIISNVVSTHAVSLQVAQKQALVDVGGNRTLGDFANVLLRAVRDVVGVAVRVLANCARAIC